MAKKRYINLGFGTDPDAVNLSSLPPHSEGQKGGFMEQNEKVWQLYKLVDGAGAAGDVVYNKSYDGKFEATVTISNASIYEVAGCVTTTVTENYFTLIRKGGLLNVKANGVFAAGMRVWPDTGSNRVVPGGVFGPTAFTAVTNNPGDLFEYANPLTGAWIVDFLSVNVTTKSTGAGTADFGIAAVNTLNDGLIDGLDLNAAASRRTNYANGGTNGKAAMYGAAGTYVTGSTASGDAAGTVATYEGTFKMDGHPNPPTIGTAQGTISAGKVSTFLNVSLL